MAKRVSHSLIDPILSQPLKGIYARLRIPAAVPPEAIVGVGHLSAIGGAVGFACATQWWWGGLLAALGVAMNHLADVLDGTHARATGQCRNGGELLDHFVDPLSFSYWVTGISYSCDCLLLGIGGVIVVYAMAVLANIKSKMVGEFTLAQFGPTEFKTLLILFGLTLAGMCGGLWFSSDQTTQLTFWFLAAMFIGGVIQLNISLWLAVGEVNAEGAPPDNTEWEVVRKKKEEEARK